MSTLVCTARAIGTGIAHIPVPMARAPRPIGPINRSIEKERRVQVLVRDNNVDQALRVLKKNAARGRGQSGPRMVLSLKSRVFDLLFGKKPVRRENAF